MMKNKKGFTIIEVVLVLAIAGLIFLMVFIALPALQRSQRNTRRRQDMSRILSAFTEYQSNNGGKMPSSSSDINDLIKKYITGSAKDTSGNYQTNTSTLCAGDQFCDPDGTPYKFVEINKPYRASGGAGLSVGSEINYASTTESNLTHAIHYWYSAKCSSNEGKVILTSGANEIAIAYYLEGGAIYCGDNQ